MSPGRTSRKSRRMLTSRMGGHEGRTFNEARTSRRPGGLDATVAELRTSTLAGGAPPSCPPMSVDVRRQCPGSGRSSLRADVRWRSWMSGWPDTPMSAGRDRAMYIDRVRWTWRHGHRMSGYAMHSMSVSCSRCRSEVSRRREAVMSAVWCTPVSPPRPRRPPVGVRRPPGCDTGVRPPTR